MTVGVGRKSTQRARLLSAMAEVAVREGYADATIARVIAHAHVSRPTFYEYFTDKDRCFLDTRRDLAARLLEWVRGSVSEGRPERALQSAVGALLRFADSEPVEARLLMCETLAGGPLAMDERDRTISEIARIVDCARAEAPPETTSPDLSSGVVIGAVHWLLSSRLRSEHGDVDELTEELRVWIESYEQPTGESRWRTLQPGPPPPLSPYTSELSPNPPAPLPPGRSSLSSENIARNQRERILYAIASLATRKGYHAATIADITATARVDSRVFYLHFRDKQEACLAAYELAFQHTMAVAAGAFFSAESWPERVWQSILAAAQFQASHPTIAHFGLVEAHAVGPSAIERIHNHAAFTIFLQEGNQYTSEPKSQTAMEAIVAASFEIAYRQFRDGRSELVPHMAYHASYLCLAPFLGPANANAFVEKKIDASRERTAPRLK
jgi:AcrR family transcriptional regulator